MQSLLLFIKQYRNFSLFIVLELLAIWLIVTQNRYQGYVFFSSANYYVGSVLEVVNSVWEYINLKNENDKLAKENAELRRRLSQKEERTGWLDFKPLEDTTITNKYDYIVAKVINNSTHKSNNYITINRGAKHGVEVGMGVITAEGIVGKVKSVSSNYATVFSLLHSEILVSSQIKRNNVIGSVKWLGNNPKKVKMLYVPRYFTIQVGDSVVTSGYNPIYPPNIMIGKVASSKAAEAFYDIDVELTNNFNQISYVYVVRNKLAKEQLELEQDTIKNEKETLKELRRKQEKEKQDSEKNKDKDKSKPTNDSAKLKKEAKSTTPQLMQATDSAQKQ
ncbi:MAG: rod shape-determining protein MreC [Microscillaceae bacterium]|nr:rod shape-determining protein MreC [Microscillaceae bacterium]MDW8460001.1 rod shape-determining protein MreC [Cytophagales bacterium]